MASLTIENYIKTIYMVCSQHGEQLASTGQLAERMGVSPGTVTSMLKTLSESELVQYRPYEGVQLTSAGRSLALRVLRRHRLIELFLVKTLALTWDEVHEEAENMEHAVSDLLVDRIDEYLGFPSADPHGDPIPRADGTIATTNSQRLDEWSVGDPFRLVRVLDQTPEFLRFLSENGLPLGTEGRVSRHAKEAGTITIKTGTRETTLACDTARKLMVCDPGQGAMKG